MKQVFFSFLVLLALAVFPSCGGQEQNQEGAAQEQPAESTEAEAADTEESAEEGQGKEYTSAYICPMHCEGSGSDQPGKCPVCEMDYVANTEHSHEGHNH